MTRLRLALVCCVAFGCGLAHKPTDTEALQVTLGERPWFPRDCSALPEATAPTVVIAPAQVGQLPTLVAQATPGTTFILEDGTYMLDGGTSATLQVTASDVTIRGRNGEASLVVIDGGWVTETLIEVAAPRFTLADVTLKRSTQAALLFNGGADSILVYRAALRDVDNEALQVNYQPGSTVDHGVIACSLFEQSAAALARLTAGTRVRALSLNGAADTLVFHNVVRGFKGGDGTSAGLVLGLGARDNWLVGNWVEDTTLGIRLGRFNTSTGVERPYVNPPCATAGYADVIGGAVCNNVVVGRPSFDTGIMAWATCGSRILHNTVYSASAPLSSSIEWRYPVTSVEVKNNLTSASFLPREGATATQVSNVSIAQPTVFVNAAALDFHLASTADAALDKGALDPDAACAGDYDGHGRDDAPDIGAFELVR